MRPSRVKRSPPRSRAKSSPSISSERACISGSRHARAGERERGLAEPLPREPPEPLPELAERRGKAGNRARRRSDRVDDELVAERDRQLGELALARRNGGEAVEVHDAGAVEGDRVAACEEAAHHGLGDARRESHRDDRVGGGPSVGEDLRADGGGGRMARGDTRPHAPILPVCLGREAATSGVSA